MVNSVETAMESFGVDLERACIGIGTTLEEYQKAKNEVNKR